MGIVYIFACAFIWVFATYLIKASEQDRMINSKHEPISARNNNLITDDNLSINSDRH